MKHTLTVFIAMLTCLATFSQSWSRPEEILKHEGDTVNLVGYVSKVDYLPGSKIARMFIRLNKPNAGGYFSVMVNSSILNQETASTYLHQYVHIKGKVETYKRKPHIMINNKNQISIARESSPAQEEEPL